MKLLWGILILSYLLKKQAQKKPLKPHLPDPQFPAQEIQTGQPALGREPWLNHLKNPHPARRLQAC